MKAFLLTLLPSLACACGDVTSAGQVESLPPSAAATHTSRPTAPPPDELASLVAAREEPLPNSHVTHREAVPAASAAASRTVRGVAVDARRGEPLPDFPFAIYTGRGCPIVEVVTDSRGDFTAQLELQDSPVSILARRLGGPPVEREHALPPDDTPWRLAFAVLPLREVRLTGGPSGSSARLDLRVWSPSGGGMVRAALRRSGEGWLVRLSEPEVGLGGSPMIVAVCDDAGYWWGARRAPYGQVFEGDPIGIELAATAVLDLDVKFVPPLEEEGFPFGFGTDSLQARLAPTPGTSSVGELAEWRTREGRWLPPGRHELTVHTRYSTVERRMVDLVAGHATHVEVQLCAVETRPVSGVVRTEMGAELEDVDVWVEVQVAGRDGTWTAYHRGRRLGCWVRYDEHVRVSDNVGRFELPSVPTGELTAAARSDSLPTAVRVSTGPDGEDIVEVTLLDGDGPGFGFRLAPGFVEEDFWVRTRAWDSGPKLFGQLLDGRTIARTSPLARDLEWAVVGSGFRPVYGTEGDFVDEGDGRWFARVAPEPGWGMRIYASVPDGAPAAGARVLADGEPVGLTDVRGALELALDARPVQVRVELDDLVGTLDVPAWDWACDPWAAIELGPR